MNDITLKKRAIVAAIRATEYDVAGMSKDDLETIASAILAALMAIDLVKEVGKR